MTLIITEINRAPLDSPVFTGTPTAPTPAANDATFKLATTSFVTTAIANAIAGVNPAVEVAAATIAAANTSTWTYNNGVSGVGATFTGAVNTAITVDGITYTTLGQRLLVKDDTQSPSGAFNGVYVLTALQTVGTGAIFTRALDYNSPSSINNTGLIPIVGGTVNAGRGYILTSTVTTVGTSPITYIIFNYSAALVALTTGFSMTGTANDAKGADVASGTTTNIAAATGNFIHITGTTTITAFDSIQAGAIRILKFDGVLTLTHNATTLILPGGVNITTAAGDIAMFVSEGGGNWRCLFYQNNQVVATPIVNNFRATLVSNTPVPTTDVTYSGAQTIYLTPYNGNQISLYNGASWNTFASAEMSLALGTLTNALPYDVFCYSNSGVPTLELTAWTNITTRATNLAYQDGILCKSGALTRRYIGSFYNAGNQSATVTMTIASPCVVTYTGHGLPVNAPVVFTNSGGALPTGITAGVTYYVASAASTVTANTFNISATVGGAVINTSGSQSGTHTCTVPTYTEDSANNRLLFNYYSGVPRQLLAPSVSANWTYTTLTYQIWNANLAYKLFFFTGVAENLIAAEAVMARNNSTTSILTHLAIGVNSITVVSSPTSLTLSKAPATEYSSTTSTYSAIAPVGLNYVAPIQQSTATGATTWIASGSKFNAVVIS